MHTNFPKFIKQCRIKAKMTQEAAAIELNVPRRSLVNYESGFTAVPDDIAVAMSKLYNAPIIRYLWLRNTLCGQFLLEVEEKDLAENILSLAVWFNNSRTCMDELLAIGADGYIDIKEMSKYTQILDTFRQLAKDILSLNFHQNKKAPSDIRSKKALRD